MSASVRLLLARHLAEKVGVPRKDVIDGRGRAWFMLGNLAVGVERGLHPQDTEPEELPERLAYIQGTVSAIAEAEAESPTAPEREPLDFGKPHDWEPRSRREREEVTGADRLEDCKEANRMLRAWHDPLVAAALELEQRAVGDDVEWERIRGLREALAKCPESASYVPPRTEREKAEGVLDQLGLTGSPTAVEEKKPWRCKCGSHNGGFRNDVCWNCGLEHAVESPTGVEEDPLSYEEMEEERDRLARELFEGTAVRACEHIAGIDPQCLTSDLEIDWFHRARDAVAESSKDQQ